MIKLFPCKTNSKVILVYCSVVPRDFPPHHRLTFVEQLSKYSQVIFIDLPSGYQLSPFYGVVKFYPGLLETIFKFDYSFAWEFFRFRKLNLFILFIYLFFQKIFLNKKVILYTTSGYYDPVYRYIPYDKSIFDCPDIHRGEFEKNKNWISKFDLVLTNTKLVAQKVKKYNENIIEVASGYRSFRKTLRLHHKIPNSVLFLGGISQRIDYDLLDRVVESLPEIHFHFIGEVYLKKYYAEPKDTPRLKKWQHILTHSNTHYLGDFSEDALKSVLPFFKVGIVPYATDDFFNKYSNPIKIYDYLASGMYIVSTPLANVAIYTEGFPVYIAESPDKFAKKVKFVLTKSDRDISKYQNIVTGLLRRESLEKKVSKVVKELKLS